MDPDPRIAVRLLAGGEGGLKVADGLPSGGRGVAVALEIGFRGIELSTKILRLSARRRFCGLDGSESVAGGDDPLTSCGEIGGRRNRRIRGGETDTPLEFLAGDIAFRRGAGQVVPKGGTAKALPTIFDGGDPRFERVTLLKGQSGVLKIAQGQTLESGHKDSARGLDSPAGLSKRLTAAGTDAEASALAHLQFPEIGENADFSGGEGASIEFDRCVRFDELDARGHGLEGSAGMGRRNIEFAETGEILGIKDRELGEIRPQSGKFILQSGGVRYTGRENLIGFGFLEGGDGGIGEVVVEAGTAESLGGVF